MSRMQAFSLLCLIRFSPQRTSGGQDTCTSFKTYTPIRSTVLCNVRQWGEALTTVDTQHSVRLYKKAAGSMQWHMCNLTEYETEAVRICACIVLSHAQIRPGVGFHLLPMLSQCTSKALLYNICGVGFHLPPMLSRCTSRLYSIVDQGLDFICHH